jgi:hypothetical protein
MSGVAAAFIIVTNVSMADHKMLNPKCNMLKIAEEAIVKHFPSFYPTSLKKIISDKGNSWELTYELPADALGGVPIVTIDKKTCKVIRVEHTQ